MNAPANVHAQELRIGAGAKGHCFVRKLRIAQLRILTISRHVIVVSAQQRDNCKGVRCIRGEVVPLQVSFLSVFVVFSLAIYSCSLLIPLLLNRFNVVVVNGHDDVARCGLQALQTIRRARYGHRIGTRGGFHIEGKRRRIQFKLLKRLPN